MKKFFLIFHGRFPSEKAASLFAAKSAEAFARQGMEVELLVPKRRGGADANPYDFYGVKDNFSLAYLPTVDLFGRVPAGLAFWLSYIAFSISAFFHLVSSSGKDDIIYSNEGLPLMLASFARTNCFYELHDFPESKKTLFKILLSRMQWILAHNRWKERKLFELFPRLAKKKVLMERNAVDIAAFDLDITKEAARKKLSLPEDRLIALYTGHLYGWKGVHALVDAAKMLPHGISVALVGGTDEDVRALKGYAGDAPNIIFAGHRPHSEMPFWQKAADVLVLPNSAKEKISAFYTSPMKLFEYMASKRPIVATDLPSIREIVGDDAAVVVAPDDAHALVAGIEMAANDAKGSEERVRNAFRWVSEHTWDKRAERILAFMK
ncbi:MAG: glycosyltransferase [Candidatus Paceibacterota bacterium]|jgi:glycosyltransferase involved in cell wall biosynthesis